MSIESFHIHLYGPSVRSTDSATSPTFNSQPAPIPASFDSAQERLLELVPSVLLEPDGSLAWAGSEFQLVGIIYDASDEIQYVELRGHCDRDRLRRLAQAVCGTAKIDDFAVMVLPQRQWKNFQSFEMSVPPGQ